MVGHSLGGGVAMQFAYQFPERCERLVLVSSGGLGSRRFTHCSERRRSPGAEVVLPWLCVAGRRECRRPSRPCLAASVSARAPISKKYGATSSRSRTPTPRQAFLAHRAGYHRRGWAARERDRPALPRLRAADPDRVGRARSVDPRPPRATPPTRKSRAAGSRSSPLLATSRTATTRGASRRSSRVPPRDGPDAGRRAALAPPAADRRAVDRGALRRAAPPRDWRRRSVRGPGQRTAGEVSNERGLHRGARSQSGRRITLPGVACVAQSVHLAGPHLHRELVGRVGGEVLPIKGADVSPRVRSESARSPRSPSSWPRRGACPRSASFPATIHRQRQTGF